MPTERTKVIQVYVSPDELQKIREAAAKSGDSMSEYMRSIVLETTPIKITGSDGRSMHVVMKDPTDYIICPPGWKIDLGKGE